MLDSAVTFCAAPYNFRMSRFVIEHLPRTAAVYRVAPLDYENAKRWLKQPDLVSLIRTTEMIAAIEVGMGVTLLQSDMPVALRPGDTALLVTLSFGVLLAWAQGKIAPLPEDWRCASLTVEDPADLSIPVRAAALAEDLLSGGLS